MTAMATYRTGVFAPGVPRPSSPLRAPGRLNIFIDPNQVTVINVGSMIDGTGAKPIEKAVVVVEGTKIKAVGQQGKISVPEGQHVQTLDFPNSHLLPGLMDSHTHLMFGVPGKSYEQVIESDTDEIMLLRSIGNALTHMKSGVTTMRENGARNKITFNLREGGNRGYVTIPRLLLCGRPVTMTGGHFFWCNQEADGVDAVRAAVRELVKDGADHIKIMASGGGTAITSLLQPSYTVEELTAIVDEAHNMGKPTTAHCHATQSIANAVEAGVDMIEHLGFNEPDGSYKFYPHVVEKMAKKGTYLSPTVQTGYRGRESLLMKKEEQGKKFSKEDQVRLDWVAAKCENQLAFLGRAWSEFGVQPIAGTDAISGFGDYCIGLELMSDAGMSNMDIIQAATGTAAKAMHVEDLTGTVVPGLEADLIVVDNNPLENIKALRKMTMVMRGGERIV